MKTQEPMSMSEHAGCSAGEETCDVETGEHQTQNADSVIDRATVDEESGDGMMWTEC